MDVKIIMLLPAANSSFRIFTSHILVWVHLILRETIIPMCHSAGFFFQSGDGIQNLMHVVGKGFTGELHTPSPLLHHFILSKKNDLAGEGWKQAYGVSVQGKREPEPPSRRDNRFIVQGHTNHQTCSEWPPSIFSRCGFLQNLTVDSFQPQNRCLALLPFKKELLLSILQCLGYLKLLLP